MKSKPNNPSQQPEGEQPEFLEFDRNGHIIVFPESKPDALDVAKQPESKPSNDGAMVVAEPTAIVPAEPTAIVPVESIAENLPDEASLKSLAIKRNRDINEAGTHLAALYLELGQALTRLKALPHYGEHGKWERSLRQWGIQRTRATKALAIAKEYNNPEQLQQLSVEKAYQQAAAKKKVKRSKHKPTKNPPTGLVYEPTESIKLISCAYEDLEIEPASVNLVVADPPWGADWMPNIPSLANWSERVLKPGGILAMFWGSLGWLDVIKAVEPIMPFRWLIVHSLRAEGLRVHGTPIVSMYQPVLLFSKTTFNLNKLIRDEYVNTGKEKDLHPWQRSLEQVKYIVENLSDPGDLVVDPTEGSGTTAEACHNLGRKHIGCDIDPACVGMWQQRFNAANANLYDDLADDAKTNVTDETEFTEE